MARRQGGKSALTHAGPDNTIPGWRHSILDGMKGADRPAAIDGPAVVRHCYGEVPTMTEADLSAASPGKGGSYWLTRLILLRLLGMVYAVAFLAAAKQILPLIGSHGLLPVDLFLDRVQAVLGSSSAGFVRLPSLFWFAHSDAVLETAAWIGLGLSCVVAAGYANAVLMAVLWALYMSFVHVGQDWYGYGWEIQLLETGFLAIFLCPLLDEQAVSETRAAAGDDLAVSLADFPHHAGFGAHQTPRRSLLARPDGPVLSLSNAAAPRPAELVVQLSAARDAEGRRAV